MKKILCLLLVLFLGLINVKAASVSVSMSGISNIDANGSFSVTISATGEDVWGLSMALNYDTSKLELIDYEGEDGFTATVGTNIVLDATRGHSGSFNAIILTFKAKDTLLPGQSTTISLSNVKGASATEMMSGNNTSKTITVNIPKSSNNNLASLSVEGFNLNFNSSTTTYDIGTTENTSINISATPEDNKSTISGTGTKNLDYGTNTFNIVVTAENGTKKTYTIKVTRPDNRSTDNNLSSLTVSGFNLKFNKNTTSYTFTAENGVKSVNINAIASDAKSTITGTGTKNLKDYSNKFSIVVTAENGSKKTYTIIINRKDSNGNLGNLSKDNTLKELTVEGYDTKFNLEETNFTLEVDNTVNNIKINAVANDSKASVEIKNINTLVVGNNLITITVTAEEGSIKIYNLNVIRKSDAPIITLNDLEKVIDNIKSNEVIIEIRDNNSVLNENILKKIKETKKEITINKYSNNNIVYTWTIDGNNIDEIKEINTNIKFNTDSFDAISELTNYADAVYLNFEHSGTLPENTKVKVYVGDRYKDGDLVNIYYFNEKDNKMENIEIEVEVKEGYIEFTLDHCSEYIVTRAIFGNNKVNVFAITTLIESILLVVIILYIILDKTGKLNKLKKQTAKKRKSKTVEI